MVNSGRKGRKGRSKWKVDRSEMEERRTKMETQGEGRGKLSGPARETSSREC